MTTYRQGDIVEIPVDYSNEPGSKRRPALILSSQHYKNYHKSIIITPISRSTYGNDSEVEIKGEVRVKAKLSADCYVHTHKLYTYDEELIIKKHGTIPEEVLLEVLEKVTKNLSRE